jgi:DNA invertase Pin-like site-specific DNA recombinase
MHKTQHTNGTQAGLIPAVAYYRKSTDEQAQSIDRQRAQVEHYAAARGYRLVHEYKDEGIAGDIFDRRPDFQEMLQAAQRREFAVILVDEPSRLSRQNPIELIEKVIAPLRRSGVKLDTAAKGPLDYESLPGIIMLTVHSHKSEDEARTLSRRSLGGQLKRAQEGLYFGWMPPYGLRVKREIDPNTGKVVSRTCIFGPEEEVRTVRFIFDAVANWGWSLRRICRELEARHVKPPYGNGRGSNKRENRWNPSTVRKLLKNRKYVGDITWNEAHVGKYSAYRGGAIVQPEGEVNRRTSRNAAEDVIMVPDVVPPIIDRDTFARAALALERAQERTSPNPDHAHYLFTHMLTCGDCGSFLRGQPVRGKKRYLCGKYKEYGTKACNRNSVTEDAVKATLFTALRDEILSAQRLDGIEAEIIRQLKEEQHSGASERLTKQIADLDKKIAKGNGNLALLPPDRLPGVIAQIRKWETERGELVERLNDSTSGGDKAKALLAEARKQLWRLRDAIVQDDAEAQAAVVREVISRIEVKFTHEHTHGHRSPTGKKRLYNRPTGLMVYVRPGLGGCLACALPQCRVLVSPSWCASHF